jgi:hypothetical protein
VAAGQHLNSSGLSGCRLPPDSDRRSAPTPEARVEETLAALFSTLQTRHFRGFPRVDFRRIFCMGWRMVAITTPRLARAYTFGKIRTRKISLDHLVRAR